MPTLWAFYRHENSREWADEPFMWHDTLRFVSMYSFTVDPREYSALPVSEFAALTAERDALAALLGEARVLVRAWDEPESHDPDAALEALRAALARIDAASGGK